ncbi:membrane-anchored junction protein isoform X3 [Falco cherrug]|uniref:membrane-anchored junction protein isoform X3 n=2 Tax=Falco TaxID=8952 RepID=UPI000FFC40EF|nr:membrane-anchored junction protein isoform X3 [Falco peregrinus]XP_055558020.1 membrane-anchored junction protein isoform X3 [Falco cherrug]
MAYGWHSGRKMSLKPFTYPLPETRFLHAGRLVYKFKIRYGNFSSAPDLDNTESAVKELEEVIRVILGNLDDLHPFSTDHFTVFPYLSKWERVSKMRFKHENVHLVPYPYICIVYLELNSFQQNVSCGKEVNKGSDEIVKRRNEVSESIAVEEMVKRRRVEVRAEVSCPQSSMGGPVESNLEQRTATSQAEGTVQLLQEMDQMVNKGSKVSEGRGLSSKESEGRGLSKFWRSIIFSPLQHLFGGKN